MSFFARSVKLLPSTIGSYLDIQIRAISTQILHHLAKRRHHVVHIYIAVQVAEHLFFFKLVAIIPWIWYIVISAAVSGAATMKLSAHIMAMILIFNSRLLSTESNVSLLCDSCKLRELSRHRGEANKPENVLYIKHKITLQLN